MIQLYIQKLKSAFALKPAELPPSAVQRAKKRIIDWKRPEKKLEYLLNWQHLWKRWQLSFHFLTFLSLIFLSPIIIAPSPFFHLNFCPFLLSWKKKKWSIDWKNFWGEKKNRGTINGHIYISNFIININCCFNYPFITSLSFINVFLRSLFFWR